MSAEHFFAPTIARRHRSHAGAESQQLMEAIRQQQQLQMQQLQQQQTQQPQGARQTAGIERQSQQQQLNMRGFDKIETLLGGEDLWKNWSWKIKTAVSRPRRVESENAEEILKDDASVDANTENASRPAKKCTVCWCERHSGRTERLGIPGRVLDVRSNRTQVGRVSMESRLRRGGRLTTAEEMEDNLSQRRMEKSEGVESLGMRWNSRKLKKAPAARGADQSTGHMKINAINYVKFVKDDATGSMKFVKIDVMDSLKFVKIVRTGSSRLRSERRANVWRRQMGRGL